MKRLSVLRHAKSSWDDQSLDDFNRPLNDSGRKAARRLGRELAERKMRFDLVLASMAARVRETIDGLQENFDFAAPIKFEPSIYEASEATLLSLVRALPEEVGSALLVGHNPGLERLIGDLTSDGERGFRRRVAEGYPTAALAIIDLPTERWTDVQLESGEIIELILPKELD